MNVTDSTFFRLWENRELPSRQGALTLLGAVRSSKQHGKLWLAEARPLPWGLNSVVETAINGTCSNGRTLLLARVTLEA